MLCSSTPFSDHEDSFAKNNSYRGKNKVSSYPWNCGRCSPQVYRVKPTQRREIHTKVVMGLAGFEPAASAV